MPPASCSKNERNDPMSDFDLDVRMDAPASSNNTSRVTSKSLCTPGCITGMMHCTTRSCSGGCSIVISR
ncbi:gallidermin/nisin family lantibiotic [Pseudonocardia sp. ICBG601]|uniref:gallidermin/nisin family lantibiotic n=1 Tax=Pseudonocardia sp. ICBG601 TaxID=2846759 RepID=UPI0035AB75EA